MDTKERFIERIQDVVDDLENGTSPTIVWRLMSPVLEIMDENRNLKAQLAIEMDYVKRYRDAYCAEIGKGER